VLVATLVNPQLPKSGSGATMKRHCSVLRFSGNQEKRETDWQEVEKTVCGCKVSCRPGGSGERRGLSLREFNENVCIQLLEQEGTNDVRNQHVEARYVAKKDRPESSGSLSWTGSRERGGEEEDGRARIQHFIPIFATTYENERQKRPGQP